MDDEQGDDAGYTTLRSHPGVKQEKRWLLPKLKKKKKSHAHVRFSGSHLTFSDC